jgi:DNA-binding SARP family transcriptional activator
MEVRLLGALEVLDEAGCPVLLPGAKRRALLAILALRPGQVVSSDRLIDELWGEEAGTTAANSLQALVSKLRRSLRSNLRPPRTETIGRDDELASLAPAYRHAPPGHDRRPRWRR